MLTSIPGRPPIELPAYYESFAWYYPNCELQTKRWFVEQAKADWVYIDGGANVGYYSILFSQLSPQGHVHAVEPTSTADMLERNLSHNQAKNVSVHRLALGQHSGRRKEKIFRLWGGAPDEFEYDFITVDHLAEKLGLTRLDCLKIDVDSFDFEVLMGAEETLARFNPWLVVELNHALGVRGYSNMAALHWLLARGYRTSLVLDYDNFVLRKGVTTVPAADAMEMRLVFPNKP